MKNILFKGEPFLLVGDLQDGGALTTMEDYQSGSESFAHLFRDGLVKRYNRVIGNAHDIVVVDEDVEEPALRSGDRLIALRNMLTWGRS